MKIISTAAAFIALGLSAHAVSLTFADADLISTNLDATKPSASFTGTFNFVSSEPSDDSFTLNSPFGHVTRTSILNLVPGHNSFLSGTIELFLRDPVGGDETASVYVLDINVGSFSNIANGSYMIYSTPFGNAAIAGQIDSTGTVEYKITATSGAFRLDAAYGSIQATIPDGGMTAALLGSSLLGLTYLRRRFCQS